jgi:DNA repair exonuclease SbcCD ATPase subunit
MNTQLLREFVAAVRQPTVPSEFFKAAAKAGMSREIINAGHESVQRCLAKIQEFAELQALLPSFSESAERVACLTARIDDLKRELAELQPIVSEIEIAHARLANLQQQIRISACDELIGMATLQERDQVGLTNKWDFPDRN